MIARLRIVLLLCGSLLLLSLLSGCTRDPNVRKQKYLDSGKIFYDQGKYREAAIQFSNAIQIDGRYFDAHYELAKTYIKLESWGNAYRELSRAVELQPENTAAQLDLGNMLLGGGALAQAEAKAQLVLAKDPNNADAHTLLANIQAAKHKPDDALQEMHKAIELAPGRSSYFLNLAMLESNNREYPKAEEDFQKAIRLDPNSLNAVESFARFYESQQKWGDAEAQYQRAMLLAPKKVSPRLALARLYLATNRKPDAEKVLRDTKSALADVPEGYRLLADFYVAQGEYDKATDEFKTLVNEHPKDDVVKKMYARVLISRNRLDEATRINDMVLKAAPRDVDGQLNKAEILVRTAHAPEAVEMLEKLAKADADNPFVHFGYGNALAATGKMEQAQTEWREAIRLRPNMLEAHQRLAASAVASGNIDQLALSAEQLISAMPASPEGYLFRARAEQVHKQYPAAEADLQKVVQLNPHNPVGYARLGELRQVQQRWTEAEAYFNKALEIAPGYPEAVQMLTVQYIQQKQTAKAVAMVDQQIAKAPNSSYLYLAKATLLANDKNTLDAAEAAAQKAVDLDPSNSGAVIVLAQLQSSHQDLNKAIATYESSLKQNPNDLRVLVLLGSLYDRHGDYQKASDVYQKALQIQPDNALAANNLAYNMLEHGGNVDVALSLAQTARTGAPNMPTTADTLAWAYYKKGVYRSAIELLEDAARKSPDNASIQFHLGMAYQKVNDSANAKQHLERVLKLDPNFVHADEVRSALNIHG